MSGWTIAMLAALVGANRVPRLEPYALERNAASYVAFAILMLVPIVVFLKRPLQMFVSAIIAWVLFAAAYSLGAHASPRRAAAGRSRCGIERRQLQTILASSVIVALRTLETGSSFRHRWPIGQMPFLPGSAPGHAAFSSAVKRCSLISPRP